jgi:hypothetical protein
MLKTIFSLTLALCLAGSAALAQVGPKQKEKPKPKKPPTEEKSELQPGERLQIAPAESKVDTAESVVPMPAEPVLSDHIKRAVFTTTIVNREPADSLDSLATDTERIYFFTEITGLADKTIRHRWIHNNEVLAEIPIPIGGPNWRVYSSKKLLPAWTGEWTVLVVDEDENVLGKKQFVYQKRTGGE